ncbi:unnamed protein product, partial [Ectocarpus sp. 12 AP-2014]
PASRTIPSFPTSWWVVTPNLWYVSSAVRPLAYLFWLQARCTFVPHVRQVSSSSPEGFLSPFASQHERVPLGGQGFSTPPRPFIFLEHDAHTLPRFRCPAKDGTSCMRTRYLTISLLHP